MFSSINIFPSTPVTGASQYIPIWYESHQEGGPEISSCHCLLLPLKDFFAHLGHCLPSESSAFSVLLGADLPITKEVASKILSVSMAEDHKVLSLDSDLGASFWLLGSLFPNSFPPGSSPTLFSCAASH